MVAALAGTAAITASGQSQPVLTGAAAYGDWHSDAPGVRRRITPADMPPPYETASASRYPTVVARPADAWPKAPPGFVVELLVGGLDNPRLIRVSPSGDIFVAESGPGRIRILRVTDGAKTPEIRIFAEDLYQPFGIAFWPPGPNPRFVYVANTDNVVRYPYRPGELKPTGPADGVDDLYDQVEIVTAQRAGRQALVLARTGAAPPGWAARPVTMEELVLGYLREPAARVVPEPGLEIVR